MLQIFKVIDVHVLADRPSGHRAEKFAQKLHDAPATTGAQPSAITSLTPMYILMRFWVEARDILDPQSGGQMTYPKYPSCQIDYARSARLRRATIRFVELHA
ncbi:hypothetical protein Rwratislav_30749 [Rhodococcus wratislaviensis IFP 2016]|nr:hypothetical protein Rwratislav_30749 [Rhodococcus wratislaviensis IFP 2016]